MVLASLTGVAQLFQKWLVPCILLSFCIFHVSLCAAAEVSSENGVLTSATNLQSDSSFPISEDELKDLAHKLSPKVDLFREVWQRDPTAEFYAGTTRDYLYWILGQFKDLNTSEQIKKKKQELLEIKFIQIRSMVGQESDADILSQDFSKLLQLNGDQFGIRKLDLINFDRLDPLHEQGQSEFNQGYIPVEKMRLSQNGIIIDPHFGNGLRDLISGQISVHFADEHRFWNTHYAKRGLNHPLLLALRHLRIVAQDYLKRHGDGIPRSEQLLSAIDQATVRKIKEIIKSARHDPKFIELLNNQQSLKWLNGSIQKSFRSYSNATAAFEIMKEMGVISLIELFPEKIESIFGYLLKIKKYPKKIS